MSIFNIFKNKKEIVMINETLKQQVLNIVKNEIIIKEKKIKNTKPNSSRIGGKPYLPKDFIWPTYTSYEDKITRHLSFLCQINLEEIKDYDVDHILPRTGLLYFFYDCDSMCFGFDPRDKDSAKIYYYDNTNDFTLLDIPNDISDEYIIPEINIKFHSKKSYPDQEEFETLNNTKIDIEEYENVLEKIGVNIDDEYEHKLLGYANTVQGEMLTEAERISRNLYSGDPESYKNTPEEVQNEIKEHVNDWILLFQLTSIEKEDFEFIVGDCGVIYFFIKKEDLKNKDFSNIHCAVQF